MSYSAAQPNIPHLNTSFDYESFIDIDDDLDIKPVPMLTPQSGIPATFASTSSPNFPEPLYNYTLYPQQTGFVRGALQETFQRNKTSGLHYTGNGNGFVMPTETLNVPLSQLDEYDFSQSVEMDFDESPTLFFGESSTGPAEFVSPSTTLVNTSSTPIKRIYPGMHSQQAAEAKSQKQEEMARQQQQPPRGQKPLPGPSPIKTAVKDPLVELSISKVLQKMRQSSAASLSDEGDSPAAGMSSMPRIKKDEEDMDSDELLLASEEGKKLSSKERRQLRNKVSARAFRSRRKEYIGQLEGELATKSQEANDLRVQNQQLQEENNRLTDLTRMLLSSQSFSGFLQELSQSGLPPPSLPKMQQQKSGQAQPHPQPVKKDVSSSAANQQLQTQHPQIGMALIPETPIDYSVLQPSNGWMNTLSTNDFHVYAVTELPTPPILDLEALSGKPTSIPGASKGLKEVPQLPELPIQKRQSATQYGAAKVDESITLDRESFALYFSSSANDNDRCCKDDNFNDITNAGEISSEDNMAVLKKLCSDLEDSCDKLAKYTSHME